LVNLLKAMMLTAAIESLVRVKSHHPETKDLKAIEDKVREAGEAIMDAIDYEGDDDEE
jgi:hypothetical protein